MSANFQTAQDFLQQADQFQLGHLWTEGSHPKTVGLSQLVNLNPSEAIKNFVAVDKEMLSFFQSKATEVSGLSQRIQNCFNRGGRLFLSGCGATGRLSLVIENLWRQAFPDKGDLLVAFMAGGDLALIHSIEKFEDYPDYGRRQLRELGFTKNDLLLASTEGGETPWVIGTALEAIALGGECTFLYCNPRELLEENLQRCQQIFNEEKIVKFELASGPQALTGSTRLQASSILMAAIGLALFSPCQGSEMEEKVRYLKDWYLGLDHSLMAALIKEEAALYKKGEYVYYTPSQHLAISVLTDTTERSPTFNLRGFDNKQDKDHPPSWCYLAFPGSEDSQTAWKKLLYREPRPLSWPEVKESAGIERLYGFDFSRDVFQWRPLKGKNHHVFKVWQKEDQLLFELNSHQVFYSLPQNDNLAAHLILKMLLNMHSTLLMGLMGRYESNVMTWVRPSNYKLVDRACRYAQQLLDEKNVTISYEALVNQCFEMMKKGPRDEAIVLELVQLFSKH